MDRRRSKRLNKLVEDEKPIEVVKKMRKVVSKLLDSDEEVNTKDVGTSSTGKIIENGRKSTSDDLVEEQQMKITKKKRNVVSKLPNSHEKESTKDLETPNTGKINRNSRKLSQNISIEEQKTKITKKRRKVVPKLLDSDEEENTKDVETPNAAKITRNSKKSSSSNSIEEQQPKITKKRRKVVSKLSDSDEEVATPNTGKIIKNIIKSSSDSESSSDEFIRAPKSLLKLKDTTSSIKEPLDASMNEPLTDESGFHEISSTSEYFDFTSILKQKDETSNNNVNKIEVKSKNNTSTKNSDEIAKLLALGEGRRITKIKTPKITEDEPSPPKELEIPITLQKTKKEPSELEKTLRRKLNNELRDRQLLMHKVHLLCWIAHGNYINSVLNNPQLLAKVLSILPSKRSYPPKIIDMKYLEDILSWFNKKFEIRKKSINKNVPILNLLSIQIETLKVLNEKYYAFIFICLLRALGIKSRIVINLRTVPIKPPKDFLLTISSSKNEKSEEKTPSKDDTKASSSSKKSKYFKSDKSEGKTPSKDDTKANSSSKKSKYFKSDKSEEKTPNRDDAKTNSGSEKSKHFKSKNSADDKKSKYFKKGDSSTKKDVKISKENEKEKKTPKSETKVNRKVLSSDEEFEDGVKKIIYWVEIFLESEESWICVNVAKNSYHCPDQLYRFTAHPVCYILAWNNDNRIKEVTKRYATYSSAMEMRNKRVDEQWWRKTLRPWLPIPTIHDRTEDEQLEKKVQEDPFPQYLSHYKNHPFYVLKKDLLKFEVIHPADTQPVGFIKEYAIYPRSCVYKAQVKEAWLREAKSIKENEEPCKYTAARPKKDKLTGKCMPAGENGLYGPWQVEDYVPPVAKDGKVPRNSFGNVDLFKSEMLPVGTIHLSGDDYPGIQKVANKLNIDCVPAVVSFEFSHGFTYPKLDGYVICEEFQQLLLSTYFEELQGMEKRGAEKRTEQIYLNWKKLIKGLLIKERLRLRYNFGNKNEEETQT